VSVPAGLNLSNASLTEVIDILARDLKINYILDPKVQGRVTINTYGQLRAVDVRNLLETILRMNGFVMVQVGNIYRIVPAAESSRLPITPQTDMKEPGDSEQMVLNLVFLKFVTSAEMSKLLEPFLGEGSKMIAYDPANLLILQDNARNMKRTIELISMFDSEVMANQRIKSFTLTHSRPSDVTKELETIFKAYAFSDKTATVRFIPVDRINTVIAVAPNPTVFKAVGDWVAKLDVVASSLAGARDNHVYKLKYGRAEIIGSVLTQLYGGTGASLSGYGLPGYGGYRSGGGGGFGGMGGSGFGGSGFGGSGFGASGYAGSGLGGASSGAFNNAIGAASAFGVAPTAAAPPAAAPEATGAVAGGAPPASTATPFGSTAAGADQTGGYLQPTAAGNQTGNPRIIPNPFDNTLVIQATPLQWESILRLLDQIDVPPRQVLIDAKIFEVDLSGGLQYGVDAVLQKQNGSYLNLLGESNKGFAGGGLLLSQGMLVGHSRQLLAFVTAAENKSRTKTIAAPQLVATDSIPASITVGQEVPTLAAQAITPGIISNGNQVFTQSIQSRGTGVNLNIIARVNASGVVTMVIDQDVSAPAPNSVSNIDSPSFTRRNVSTQITVEDGDTIAIGGIIQETITNSSAGIPGLHRIPIIGGAFGQKTSTKQRTELIVFLTPHVIYDMNQVADATEELRSRMKDLQRDMRRN
jgi:general secretion pathway protein D